MKNNPIPGDRIIVTNSGKQFNTHLVHKDFGCTNIENGNIGIVLKVNHYDNQDIVTIDVKGKHYLMGLEGIEFLKYQPKLKVNDIFQVPNVPGMKGSITSYDEPKIWMTNNWIEGYTNTLGIDYKVFDITIINGVPCYSFEKRSYDYSNYFILCCEDLDNALGSNMFNVGNEFICPNITEIYFKADNKLTKSKFDWSCELWSKKAKIYGIDNNYYLIEVLDYSGFIFFYIPKSHLESLLTPQTPQTPQTPNTSITPKPTQNNPWIIKGGDELVKYFKSPLGSKIANNTKRIYIDHYYVFNGERIINFYPIYNHSAYSNSLLVTVDKLIEYVTQIHSNKIVGYKSTEICYNLPVGTIFVPNNGNFEEDVWYQPPNQPSQSIPGSLVKKYFIPVYEEEKLYTLPDINGYEGKFTDNGVIYGCQEKSWECITHLNDIITKYNIEGKMDIGDGNMVDIEQITEVYSIIKKMGK